jgi:hypothetical protein
MPHENQRQQLELLAKRRGDGVGKGEDQAGHLEYQQKGEHVRHRAEVTPRYPSGHPCGQRDVRLQLDQREQHEEEEDESGRQRAARSRTRPLRLAPVEDRADPPDTSLQH